MIETLINKPEFVYIPLTIDEDYLFFVKKGDYVFKGMLIAKTKKKPINFIFSSISGQVIGFEEKKISLKEKLMCIKIENDYKEILEEKNNCSLNEYNKSTYFETLKNKGLNNLIKENLIETLIINSIDLKPYIKTNLFIAEKYISKLLEIIDFIIEINHIKKCYILVSSGNKKIKKIFNRFLGTYPNIKLVETKLRSKNPKKILNNLKYSRYHVKNNIEQVLIYDLNELLTIKDAIQYLIGKHRKYITLQINKNIKVIDIKFGTLITDIIPKNMKNFTTYIYKNKKLKICDQELYTSDIDYIKIVSK